MSKYVQHKSGQGEKWAVSEGGVTCWFVRDAYGYRNSFSLPKSEFIEVPAPEVWTDVTAECECDRLQDDITHLEKVILKQNGYRLRKVRLYTANPGLGSINGVPCIGKERHAFIVEKREL